MSRFLNGVLVGLGIGLLIAPMKGEEMRHLARERYNKLREALPEQEEQLQQEGQPIAPRLRKTGRTLGKLAQQSARKAKQKRLDVARATQ